MIKVDPDWWKGFFDEMYLVTDARSVCDQELTNREVSFLEEVLKLKKSDRILDLCGGHGRHSVELSRRGYEDLTVLDYSQYLVEFGKRSVDAEGLRVKFYQGDARSTGLKDEDYSVVLVMGNSFGYFLDEESNTQILCEIHRLLRRDGKVLLDLTDGEFLANNFRTISWHEPNEDIGVFRIRELDGELVRAREIVLSKQKGVIKDGAYCERLYGEPQIVHLLDSAGFEEIKLRKNFSLHRQKADYGFMTSRMIVTGRKP